MWRSTAQRQIRALLQGKIRRMDANAGGKVKGKYQHSLLFSGESHRCASHIPVGPQDLMDFVGSG